MTLIVHIEHFTLFSRDLITRKRVIKSLLKDARTRTESVRGSASNSARVFREWCRQTRMTGMQILPDQNIRGKVLFRHSPKVDTAQLPAEDLFVPCNRARGASLSPFSSTCKILWTPLDYVIIWFSFINVRDTFVRHEHVSPVTVTTLPLLIILLLCRDAMARFGDNVPQINIIYRLDHTRGDFEYLRGTLFR